MGDHIAENIINSAITYKVKTKETKMKTLEEFHAHYKAVRARLNAGMQNKQPTEKPKLVVHTVYIKPVVVVKKQPIITAPSSGDIVSPAQKILAEVAEKHNLPISAFKSQNRTLKYIECRHEACYRLKVELNLSLKQIGRLLGNRDHTTVLNAVRKHQRKIDLALTPESHMAHCAC